MKLDLHERKRVFILVGIILHKVYIHSHNLVPESHFLLLKKKITLCVFSLKGLGLSFFPLFVCHLKLSAFY